VRCCQEPADRLGKPMEEAPHAHRRLRTWICHARCRPELAGRQGKPEDKGEEPAVVVALVT